MSKEELQNLTDECADMARTSIVRAGFLGASNTVIAVGQIASTLLEYRLRTEHS
jgi:hypothetical protein